MGEQRGPAAQTVFRQTLLVERELEQSGQIVLRYEGESPNGSVAGIAGIVNAEGNVMGLMPHPEHAVDALTSSTDGALLLGSLVDAARVDAAEPAAV